MTGVMDPSGSGKSSLLHCPGGVDKADSGRELYRGNDVMHFLSNQIAWMRRTQLTFRFNFSTYSLP
jgi:lipoprotein-releasing system ATP-binding protein